MNPPVLAINNLCTHFFTRDGVVKAVDGVSLEMAHGETLVWSAKADAASRSPRCP